MSTYDACVSDIGEVQRRTRFTDNRGAFALAQIAYDAASQTHSWGGLPRAAWGNNSALIVGELTKQELTSLYTAHMVGASGLSRVIYDDILNSSDTCPFCGGLGHVWTLDHYLPKAHYPAYSINPKNLVPCCRDCNSGKSATAGVAPDDQTIHPYLDAAKFFGQRWVCASILRTNPIVVSYECCPPDDWSAAEKARAVRHFNSYKLAYRFSVQAGAELSKVVQIRAGSLRSLSRERYRDYLLENADCADFDLNGWSRTMYAALARTEWFIQTDFTMPDWAAAAA